MTHPNGANGITCISYVADRPSVFKDRFEGIYSAAAVPLTADTLLVTTDRGNFEVLTRELAKTRFHGVDIPATAQQLPSVLAPRIGKELNGAEISDLVLIAAVKEGLNVDYLSSVFMQNHWINNVDLNDEKSVRIILEAQGLESDNLLELAQTKESLNTYEENTKEAIDLSAFGSPTYVVDGDMFYGQDNLILVERALGQPFNL